MNFSDKQLLSVGFMFAGGKRSAWLRFLRFRVTSNWLLIGFWLELPLAGTQQSQYSGKFYMKNYFEEEFAVDFAKAVCMLDSGQLGSTARA